MAKIVVSTSVTLSTVVESNHPAMDSQVAEKLGSDRIKSCLEMLQELGAISEFEVDDAGTIAIEVSV